MEHRNQRVVLETSRLRIEGTLTLPAGGYRSRMSDFLNSSDRDFISLTDVVIQHIEHPDDRYEHEYLAVSRNHIVMAAPVEGVADSERSVASAS